MRAIIHLLVISCCLFETRSQTGGRCTTARNEPGNCINIRSCPFMLNLLRTERNNPQTVDYLRKSICTYQGSDPVICCPGGSPSQNTRPPVTSGSSSQTPDSNRNTNSLFPVPPACGMSTVEDHQRIVGGVPAELGAWPWIAALGYRSRSGAGPKFLCGGTLINKRYVVTAAHCTRHPTSTLYLVRLGEHDLDESVNDGARPVDIQIEKIIPNTAYDSNKLVDDIALLRLREDAQFNSWIQPICLPINNPQRSSNFLSNSPFIAGWGATSFKGTSSNRLLQAQIEVVDNNACNRVYNTKGSTITRRHICAGNVTGGVDACQGDSGGPLMLPSGPRISYYLIGVVSYGYKCAEPGFPGVYARVTEYIDWIQNNMTP